MARCGWVTSTVKGIIIISTTRSILSQQHIGSFSLSPCERRKHPILYYSHHDDRELKQSCPWIVNISSSIMNMSPSASLLQHLEML